MKTRINLLMATVLLTVAARSPALTITNQPSSRSVSLGANVTNRVSATGTSPLNYQWRFNGLEVPGANTSAFVLSNVQLTNAGSYTVVVADPSGSVTSMVATLTVDPTFTKITTGQIVSDRGEFQAAVWGDYNNDGFLDLFVANHTGLNALYRNNGGGSFTRISTGPFGTDRSFSVGCAWGDYDNDAFLDLFVARDNGANDYLYRNNGNGTFTKITTGPIVSDAADSTVGSWGDYDNDGFLDLFVSNFGGNNSLHRNNGDGTFTKVTSGPIVSDGGHSNGSAWADFNNDGYLDLFVANSRNDSNFLYQNNGNGSFAKITNSVATNAGHSSGAAWGDYDNDGDLDLFVTNSDHERNFFYRNNGDGTFASVLDDVVTAMGPSESCAWGDYDNDGFLDLFVANGVFTNVNNFLFHNNGDGTFTSLTDGSFVNDGGLSYGCAWGDFDNDGFLDLFVANTGPDSNFLYRNNGNTNSWIDLKLVGIASNRSAIGAKVRVKAVIRGTTLWQLREISSGDGFSGNGLTAHFGLGDAALIDTVRIEWPSGIVQVLTNVAVKQVLSVTEHQVPSAMPPKVTSAQWSTNGMFRMILAGAPGLLYVFEASTNLVNWTRLATRTNLNGTLEFVDPASTNLNRRFYRAVAP